MKRLLFSGLGLVLIAVSFLAFNSLTSLVLREARLDLTEHQLYTISPGTRQLLANLKEPINLSLYFSDSQAQELPPLRNYAKRIDALLRSYEREAFGKLKLQVIDPAPFSTSEEQAARFGLQGVPLQQGGAPLYLGLAATNTLGDTQIISLFSPSEERLLEYDISRLLHALNTPQRPIIGVMSTLPVGGDADNPPWALFEETSRQFEVRYLKPQATLIPADLSVLMLVHPKELDEVTLYAIDQFVLGGGKLLVFVDPLSQVDNDAQGHNNSDLPRLFNAWGMQLLAGKVVADQRYAMTAPGAGQRPQRQMTWLNLPPESLNADDLSTTDLQRMTLASAGVLQPSPNASTIFVPLIQSSTSAVLFDAESFGLLDELGDQLRQLKPEGQRYSLAARIYGPAHTAFPQGITGQENGLKEAANINVIAVADTDLLTDRLWLQEQQRSGHSLLRSWADNDAFVINSLDYLSGSEALVSLRARGRFSRPFSVVDELQRQAQIRFQSTYRQLSQSLAETDRALQKLRSNPDPHAAQLPAEQIDELAQRERQQHQLREQLRSLQYQLNNDVDALGRTLKWLNIGLVPLLLTLLALLIMAIRRLRSGKGD
ncbi:Gldg family protein [Pseudomonas sp. SDM007_2]|uniref:GldG family protein n=1 Tax=Pseudomonas hygromyciniae TaxID=2812000 RepID=UPI0019686119|nr:Gldg family protein [Pseudomonas hygromyciniae]MBN0978577.1 Gldg family protein [Pseudomonas hygromyciniae]